MLKKRQLRQFRFILNVANTQDAELSEIIRDLKSHRSFTKSIRIGVRLFWSLRNGKTDYLIQEFPWLIEHFESSLTDVQEQLSRIESKLADPELLQALQEQQKRQAKESATLQADKSTLTPPQEIDIAMNASPKNDDNPTYNMMLSIIGINGNLFDLPIEILEDGVTNERLLDCANDRVAKTCHEQSNAEKDIPKNGVKELDDAPDQLA